MQEAQTTRATYNRSKEVKSIEPSLVSKEEESEETILHAFTPNKPTSEGGTPTTLGAKLPTHLTGDAEALSKEALTSGGASVPRSSILEESPQSPQTGLNGVCQQSVLS